MIKRILKNEYLLFALRLLLGFVFIYAAASKINDADSFAQSIANYKILPNILINIFAIILPWVEICAGLLLIFGINVKENSLILTSLLIIFIAAIIISLLRGLDIQCGCFGTVDGTRVGAQKLLEDFGLLIAGFILIKSGSSFLSFGVKN